MVSNYFTLQYIASRFDSILRGWQIRQIYSQKANELVVAFNNQARQLVILCRQDSATAYLHDGLVRARRNTINLFGECIGSNVTGVEIRPADRVIIFRLGPELTLAALLYGAHPNVLLLDRSDIVLNSFKNASRLRNTVIRFRDGALVHDFEAYWQAIGIADSAASSSIVLRSFPILGRTLVQEAFVRAGIPPSRPVSSLDRVALLAIEESVRSILYDLKTSVPRIYADVEGKPVLFSLVPLRSTVGLSERVFHDINDALRFFLGRRDAASGFEKFRSSFVAQLERGIEKAHRAFEAIGSDARAAESAEAYERFGKALLVNLSLITKGMHEFNANVGGQQISIPLQPSLTPVQNAQHYFKKARRARIAREETAARLTQLSAQIDRGVVLLAAAEQVNTKDEARKFLEGNAAQLKEFHIGTQKGEREQLPFRVFAVEGGFEVLVGKSGENNDLLSFRYAKPADLWFHVRGGSGSHVVLKVGSGKGEPGKRACAQAAGIAAYFSKMKNARMVPVAMTEQRFVRKPRGAPAGTVLIEREKVIFAEPGLPEMRHN